MILYKEFALQQVNQLLRVYNGLSVEEMLDTRIVLSGRVLIKRMALGYQLCKEYQMKIILPLCVDVLPYVIDSGNQIDKNYPHRYIDGQLCLETDTAIRIYFINGFDLVSWMYNFVEPYYFSYEYFQRYGVFPFGERAHGTEGILQTYGEIFNEPNYVKVFKLMKFIQCGRYRGHLPCPCGSGTKLRLCHGQLMRRFFESDDLKIVVQTDYKLIKETLDIYHEQFESTRKAK